MLRRAKGATIDEIVEALEWQPHTVRGANRRGAEEETRAHDCFRKIGPPRPHLSHRGLN
ncbi:MAG: DUF3489 domain-containing protein [Rhodoplanes sp.]